MKAAVVDNRFNRVDTKNREIVELAEAAGYEVVIYYEVELDPPHAKNYLPEKKMDTFKMMLIDKTVDKIIFAQPLRSHQVGTLNDEFDLEVIDKPRLVLEIFEKKANSIDIKLQIQLAQLKYTLPQMVSQVSDAVRGERAGYMGSGEQVTDIVASDIRSRMKGIEAKLREFKNQAQHKQEDDIPRLPIVGYYSAGKSTLFNILTSSERDTGAEAFTTMVMKTQRSLVAGYPIDLIDTVGLVDLPTNILSAFELMLSQIFSFSGMILCLNSALPVEHWKSQLADFEDYLDRFTGNTSPKVIVALTKTDITDTITLDEMKTHLLQQEWLGTSKIIETRMDTPEKTQEVFIKTFEELFADYLTEFFYQHVSPSTASKIHDVARIDKQEWHNDGTTSLIGVGPTNLLDELKGEIFS